MERSDELARTDGSATRLTYDDLVAMFPDEDGVRRELIDGELFVMASSFTLHQQLVVRLATSLGSHLDAHPEQGEVLLGPFDIVMTPYDVVIPDLTVLLHDQSHILTEKNVQGAPGLVIEILSADTRERDETLKRDLFDRQGVREFWMVDPNRIRVIVYRRAADGSFPLVATLDANETLTTPLLPGWGLALGQLFR